MHVQRIRSIRAKQENNDQYTTHIMQGLRDIFLTLDATNSAINWQIRGLYLPSLATSAQVETVHEYEMSFNLKIAQYWIKRVEVFKLY